MAWTLSRQPIGPNRAPLLTGYASDNSGASVPVAVNQANGHLLTDATVAFTPTLLTTVLTGVKNVTTAGTRVQLPSNAIASVTIKAKSTNTDLIYIGGSGVSSTNGYALAANDSVSFDMSNTDAVYLDAVVSGEGVTWLAVD